MVMETPTALLDFPVRDADDHLSFDQSPEERIRQAIASRTSGRIRGLGILVEGTKLVITGQSSTYYGKQLATHAALDVAEALVIQNDVVVAAR